MTQMGSNEAWPGQKIVTRGPLTVLWRRTTLDRVPESWFIHNVLLAGVGRPIRVVPVDRILDAPFLENMLVVSLGLEFAPYLQEARRRGVTRIALLHLGDEQRQDDLSFYAHADVVLRNYWFAGVVDDEQVHWVPNGYATGVGPGGPRLAASRRSSAGFFAGALGMRALSAERAAMRDVVAAHGLPFRLHWTPKWSDRLGPASYCAALRDARFAPAPGGNSPETIRLYDALECGAIPIVLRSAFVDAPAALNNPPFLLLENWSQLPEAYAVACAGDIDELQQKTMEWWRHFKLRQSAKVALLLNAAIPA